MVANPSNVRLIIRGIPRERVVNKIKRNEGYGQSFMVLKLVVNKESDVPGKYVSCSLDTVSRL